MAKIPAKEREEKLNAMNLAIRHTLEIEGWDAVTYKKLADTLIQGKVAFKSISLLNNTSY